MWSILGQNLKKYTKKKVGILEIFLIGVGDGDVRKFSLSPNPTKFADILSELSPKSNHPVHSYQVYTQCWLSLQIYPEDSAYMIWLSFTPNFFFHKIFWKYIRLSVRDWIAECCGFTNAVYPCSVDCHFKFILKIMYFFNYWYFFLPQ